MHDEKMSSQHIYLYIDERKRGYFPVTIMHQLIKKIFRRWFLISDLSNGHMFPWLSQLPHRSDKQY